MVNWKNLDLEFDEHAFKHGIKEIYDDKAK